MLQEKTQNVAVLLKTSLDVSPSLFSAGMSVGSHALYKSLKVMSRRTLKVCIYVQEFTYNSLKKTNIFYNALESK